MTVALCFLGSIIVVLFLILCGCECEVFILYLKRKVLCQYQFPKCIGK